MGAPDYPDRDRWPEYWRAIRRGVVLVAVSLIVSLALFALTESSQNVSEPWGVVLVLASALIGTYAADRLIDWIAGRWERRLGGE